MLYRNKLITITNQEFVIEILRLLAEILIWGDQNDEHIFV